MTTSRPARAASPSPAASRPFGAAGALHVGVHLLALTLVALGCPLLPPDPSDVPTVLVEGSRTFQRNVRGDGLVRAVEATPITAPSDAEGALKISWIAPDGSHVNEGDVVMRFDASEMERRLADSRDEVTAAKRQIEKVTIESAATRHKRELAADLADHEAIAAKEFELKSDTILSKVEMAEEAIDLELAQAKSDHARGVQAVEKAVAENQLELHDITRRQHGRELLRARSGLERLKVLAPKAGILVLARSWSGEPVRIGDTVWSGQKVAEIPVIAELEAEVFVLEADAGSLVEGLPATVFLEARPELSWVGKVKRVDTLAQPRHPKVPVHYIGVVVSLERREHEIMRVGQRARATIVVERPSSIIVPRQAVFQHEGKTVVYRDAGDGFDPVEVTLGTGSPGRVVIESGLEGGERIALRDPTQASRQGSARPEAATEAQADRRPGGPS